MKIVQNRSKIGLGSFYTFEVWKSLEIPQVISANQIGISAVGEEIVCNLLEAKLGNHGKSVKNRPRELLHFWGLKITRNTPGNIGQPNRYRRKRKRAGEGRGEERGSGGMESGIGKCKRESMKCITWILHH